MSTTFVYKLFIIYHIMIYMKIVEILLVAINVKMKEAMHQPISRHSMIYILRQFKWIHFKIAKNIQMLNDRFAWIYLLLIVESFFLTSLATAFIFVYAETVTKLKTLSILREYAFFFSKFLLFS